MERPYTDLILLDGVDITSYVLDYKIKGTQNNDDIPTGNIFLDLSVDSVVELIAGKDVVVSRGVSSATEDYLLRGTVKKVSVEENKINLYVEGRFALYKKKLLTYSFDKDIDTEAGEYSEIWKTIIEGGGLSASAVTSGFVRDKFICNDSTRFERATMIAKTLYWQQYDDYNNNYVRLEPRGYSTFGTVLTVGDNIITVPIWNDDIEPMRNSITIKGAVAEDTVIDTSNTGDGSTKDFYVDFTPKITEVKVNNVLKTRGTVGSSETYDYTVDTNLKKFSFISAPGAGLSITLQYTTDVPTPVRGTDYTSVDKYSTSTWDGMSSEAYSFPDIVTVNDAKQRLKSLLSYLKDSFVSTKIECYGLNQIRPGMIVQIVDSIHPDRSGSYIVFEVSYQYPEPFDILKVGSTDFNIMALMDSIHYRLSALESTDLLNVGLLTAIIQLTNKIYSENRYIKKRVTQTDDGVLYWDHPVQGDWGDDAETMGFDWGDDTDEASSAVTTMLMPGHGRFREYVYDSTFYDNVNSVGVTWNNSTHTISIAATTGVLYTTALSIGVSYSQYTVTLGDVSASGLTVDISCDDGSTWEPVTLETLSDFIAITSNVILRISNTTGSSIDIASILNSGNAYTYPAIEVLLQ